MMTLAGAMLLAMNARAAGTSPSQNKMQGVAEGSIIVENAGASSFYVSDTDPTVGYASPLSIDVAGSAIRVGKELEIKNRGSKATTIGTKNTTLAAPLTLPAKSGVLFINTAGGWVSHGVMSDNTPPPPGAPASGQVNVPPVSN
ncbi:hypothetical protein ACWHY4_09420 [Pseudomonas sp. E2-15]